MFFVACPRVCPAFPSIARALCMRCMHHTRCVRCTPLPSARARPSVSSKDMTPLVPLKSVVSARMGTRLIHILLTQEQQPDTTGNGRVGGGDMQGRQGWCFDE